MSGLQCQHCGAPMPLDEPIGRDATCEVCGRDLRACRQCRHYDIRYNNSCRETMADPVEDKERRNFCEYFSFNRAPFTAAPPSRDREKQARERLEGLFKSGPAGQKPRETDPRKRLDALFKKPEPEPDE